jgi:hypothetical protein
MNIVFPPWMARLVLPLTLLAAAVAIGLVLRHALATHDARLLAACDARYAALALQAQIQARAEEQRRVLAQAEVAREARDQAERLRRDRAGLDAAAARLRSAAASAAGEHPGASDPAAPDGRPAAADPNRVLALVLSEAEERLRALAAIADERGNAGATCERAYEALTAPESVDVAI